MIQTIQCRELVCDICDEHEVLQDDDLVKSCSVCECDMCKTCLGLAEHHGTGWVCARCLSNKNVAMA